MILGQGNPAASLHVLHMFGEPVLFSGLAALILTKYEISLLTQHYKNILQRLMKLYDETPDCVVHFLSGSLTGAALLHLRQLTLFGMISRLEDNILRKIAVSVLVEGKPSCTSWFQQIRDICIQYLIPHPLIMLESPLPKFAFKKLCKQRVTCFWRKKFQIDAAKLTSLRYLKPEFISLTSPHPIFTTLNGNPYQTKKAKIQSRFLSGRYRTEKLCRFWSKNAAGICLHFFLYRSR